MTEHWQPKQEDLAEVFNILQALRDPTRADHKRTLESLDGFIQNSSFVLHLLHLFARGEAYQQMGLTIDLRQLSGLILKNYVLPKLLNLEVSVQQLIKSESLEALKDQLSDIQNTAGIILSRFTVLFPIEMWIDIVFPLMQMLELNVHGHVSITLGSLLALTRICEDSCDKLSSDFVNRPLDQLVPRLIALFKSDNATIRQKALASINSLLFLLSPPQSSSGNDWEAASRGSQSLILNMNELLQGWSALAGDANASVRKTVCQGIVLVASLHIAVLEPAFSSICEFMLQAVLDGDEGVAIEGCEYWAVIIENEDARGRAVPLLPRLIPNLISRLRLTEEQLMQERMDEEDQASGEKKLNFKPVHHKPSSSENSKNEEDEKETGRDVMDGDDASARWTLRKEAALLMDNVAVSFDPALILPLALPPIQSALSQSEDIWRKEAGMLALGTLSNGCINEMTSYLPGIYAYLLSSISDGIPEIRCIGCWVVSRYCEWLLQYSEEDEEDHPHHHHVNKSELFATTTRAFLTAMADNVPKVQAAGCSAFSTLISIGGEEMNAFLPDIMNVVQYCFSIYGVKSTMHLIDVIGTLADNVGDSLSDPQFTPFYLPVLMAKFRSIEDTDMHLFPLLECLTCLSPVLGTEIDPYCAELFQRCLRIIQYTMAMNSSPEHMDDAPVKDFAICGLDVLSGLLEGLGKGVLSATTPEAFTALLHLLFLCIRDPLSELRQSAFSLAGEICKSLPSILTPAFQQELVAEIALNLTPDFPMVCNNAAWTLGELAVQVGGASVSPYLGRLMVPMIQMMHDNTLQLTLKQNLAIAIGRLGVTNTAELKDMLPEFLGDFCKCIKYTPCTHERDHAFAGLIALLTANPGALFASEKSPQLFLLACASWEDPPMDTIRMKLREILIALRQHDENNWRKLCSGLEAESYERIHDIFQLP